MIKLIPFVIGLLLCSNTATSQSKGPAVDKLTFNNGKLNDYVPKDISGLTMNTVNLLSPRNVSVLRDSKGLQKNDLKTEFFYYENGVKKGMAIKVASSWRDWWAHSMGSSNLAFSEFIIGIQVYSKETNELVCSKDYTLKENEYLVAGSPMEDTRSWFSEPFSCEHWIFTITVNTKILKWGLGTFSSSEVIKYNYDLNLKIETK